MISNDVYQCWKALSSIPAHAAKSDGVRLEGQFQQLSQIQDAGALRKALVDYDDAANEALAWHLLNRAMREDLSPPDLQQTLALLEWMMLIAEYAGKPSLVLKGHGSLLKGMLLHNHRGFQEAQRAYWEAEEAYSAAADLSAVLSVCLYCHSNLKAEVADLDGAGDLYERARKSALAAGEKGTAWIDILERDRARTKEQSDLILKIIGEPTADRQQARLDANAGLIDLAFLQLAEGHNWQLVFQSKHEEALQAARLTNLLLARFGKTDDFRNMMVDYYVSERDYDRAESMVRSLLEERPGDEELLLRLGSLLMQMGRQQEALDVLHQVLETNPRNADVYSLIGGHFAGLKQWDLARQYLEKALEIDPDHPGARLFLRDIPTAAVTFDPQSKQIMISEAALKDSQSDQLADSIMAAIIAANPDQTDELLAAIAQDRGEEAAQRVLAIAQRSAPRGSPISRPASHLDRAEELFAQRKLTEAIEEYRLAIDEDPNNAHAYMGLGDAYYMKGDFQVAISYFEESIAIEPAASTYRFMGDAYLRLSEPDKAVDAYQNALKLDPGYGPARQMLERALQLKERR